jgi:hypothetical protein
MWADLQKGQEIAGVFSPRRKGCVPSRVSRRWKAVSQARAAFSTNTISSMAQPQIWRLREVIA